MGRPDRRRLPACRRIAPLLVVAGLLLVVPAAGANAIAGATYTGTHSAGGPIRLTVAADGAAVESYRAEVPGDTCQFVAQGDAGVWEGGPIVGGAFEYRLYDAVLLRGSFPAAGAAAGTLKLYNSAVPGVKPACDTGTVTWTATTSATAPGTQPPGTQPPGTPPGTQPPATRPPQARAYRTYVLLRTRGAKLLTGRLRSLGKGCAGGRTVRLVRGARTLRSARTKADGTFSFRRTPAMRGASLRVTVSARRGPAVICTAAASRTVRLARR